MANENNFENFDFGIEETGTGSQELLEGLIGSSTTDPDEIEEIDENEDDENSNPKKGPKKAAKPIARKAVKAQAQQDEEEDEEEEFPSLQDQLDDEEEDEDVIIKPKVKLPAKKKVVEPEENEDDQDEGTEDENAGEEDEDDQQQGTPFNTIAKELFRLGVFTAEGEDSEEVPEINSPEEFLQQFEIEKKKGAATILENFLGRYGSEYKDAFEAIFINGVSPQEYLQVHTQIESFKDMNLDGVENQAAQEKVMRTALKEQGFDPEDIDAEIERLINYGDLEVASKRNHKMLVKKEERRLQDLAEQKKADKDAEARREHAYQTSISKILNEKAKLRSFDGIPLTPKEAQEAFDYMSTKKYTTPSGELLTEFDKEILELKRPENHELRVKLGLLLRNKLDLSKIKKTAVSEESNQLFSELASKKVKKVSNPKNSAKKVTSWFNS